MFCNELDENLMLYADNALVVPEVRAVCAEHLAQCPLCRAELAEFQKMRGGLRQLRKVALPPNLVNEVRDAVALEISAAKREPRLSLSQQLENTVRLWLMPYSFGALASILLFLLSFSALHSSMNALRDWKNTDEQRAAQNQGSVFVAHNAPRSDNVPPSLLLTPEEYSALRLDYSAESPSLNPNSSFVALTSSLTKDGINDDSIVIVADVFSDGLAKVSQVIRASRDRRTMRELEKSLQVEPAFVTSKMDNRPETVRVVYLIQKVEVR